MPVLKIALPGRPRDAHAHRQVTLVSAKHGSLTLDITDPQVDWSNLGTEWVQTPRPAADPYNRSKAPRLPQMKISARLGGSLSKPIEEKAWKLGAFAGDTDADPPITVHYGPLEVRAGPWRLTDHIVREIEREQGTNACTLAEIELTFTVAGPSLVVPSAVSKPKPAPTASKSKKPAAKPKTYVVKSGDTLSAIAQRECGNANDWHELAKVNHLKNPNLIFPGQRLTLVCTG